MSTLETTPSTSIRDTLDQLRELYHAVKKKTKKREDYHKEEEDGQLDLAHFTSTATRGSEQQEEERIQMNKLPYQSSADYETSTVQL